jgi:ATP-dependent protease ClpP protease subunit
MAEQAPIRRDLKYRPNHNRSVSISGIIDDTLVSSLLPEIVKLQDESRQPITVYIDSPGGDTESARLLLDALRASDQDRSEPCRLITVALGEASSAASDILTAGDYALAYPFSSILCHGTRIRPSSSFTKAEAAGYAKYMAGQDEGFALTLARNCIDRFMFRTAQILKQLCGPNASKPTETEIESATPLYISQILHRFLLQNAHVNKAILLALDTAREKSAGVVEFSNRSGLLDENLKAGSAEDFRRAVWVSILKNAIRESSSRAISFADLEQENQILCDSFERHHIEMVVRLVLRWGLDLPGSNEIPERKSLGDSASADGDPSGFHVSGAFCAELWFLFVFFCRQLQTGDFPMTATEAYWLGLIDEVIGLDLPSPRILVENAPDLPSEQQGPSEK